MASSTSAAVSFDAAQAMVTTDARLMRAVARVSQLDFTLLKRKLMEERAWTSEYCDDVESLYRQFLALNAIYPDRKICPTGPVDEFWHAHILDTRAYEREC